MLLCYDTFFYVVTFPTTPHTPILLEAQPVLLNYESIFGGLNYTVIYYIPVVVLLLVFFTVVVDVIKLSSHIIYIRKDSIIFYAYCCCWSCQSHTSPRQPTRPRRGKVQSPTRGCKPVRLRALPPAPLAQTRPCAKAHGL